MPLHWYNCNVDHRLDQEWLDNRSDFVDRLVMQYSECHNFGFYCNESLGMHIHLNLDNLGSHYYH